MRIIIVTFFAIVVGFNFIYTGIRKPQEIRYYDSLGKDGKKLARICFIVAGIFIIIFALYLIPWPHIQYISEYGHSTFTFSDIQKEDVLA